MEEEKLIRKFSAKDSNDKIYEIKVFEAIVQVQLTGYELKPYRDEIMCIGDSVVSQNGSNYFVEIDGKQIDLYDIK